MVIIIKDSALLKLMIIITKCTMKTRGCARCEKSSFVLASSKNIFKHEAKVFHPTYYDVVAR